MKDKIIIYLCDDNVSFVETIERKLKNMLFEMQRACELTTFTNGETLTEPFGYRDADVVFLDIDIPLMDGLETAAELQKIKSDVNIVICRLEITDII